MKKLLVALVIASLAVAAPAFAAQKETETVDRTIPFAANGTLKLKTFSGRVTITGKSGNDVVVHAIRRATRDRLERVKLEIDVTGTTIRIETNRKASDSWFDFRGNTVVETDLDIQVPANTKLDVSTFSSSVTVSGVSGPHDVHGFSSNLTLRDIDGPLRARTFSGNVHIELASSSRPELDVDTFSGDVSVRVFDGAKANLSFNSFSGDLRSDVPLTLQQKTRRRVNARLNDGGSNELHFKTFSGDVRLTR